MGDDDVIAVEVATARDEDWVVGGFDGVEN